MNHIELQLTVGQEFADILMAELGNIGYETFTEEIYGLNAYIFVDDFDEKALQELIERYQAQTTINYKFSELQKQNWNEEWERNFQPITVLEKGIRVRASFHELDSSFQYDIIINPKMSFGTGHHETTSMMMELQLVSIHHEGKKILDVGSGTGILAVLASKLGASKVDGLDIEEWAVENAIENVGINNCSNVSMRLGTIENQPQDLYDVVLANINRNILLSDIPQYVNFMQTSASFLAISGFYQHDVEDIVAVASASGLSVVETKQKNNWTAILLKRD
ncbi:MAG: 50S ribosomal protein L11 methyltransferase [Pseudarcicella sp.]|nr:50S ribosomal protein L11 methyltransferase [Pseudarcicella sp.]